MTATFMDLIKVGVHRKDFCQWPQMKWYLCQKFNLKLKFHKKLVEKFEQFVVLFTGFFGLQNGIFGKFYWFFSFAKFGNPVFMYVWRHQLGTQC